jgi:signal transduction histidine kinase
MDGDPNAISRLILNLLSNAAKHTADGEIEVRIKLDRQPSAQRWIDISVCDTGEGIPAKIFPQLGQAFALNRGIVGTGHITGSGVGLSVCKGIVEAHGGTMSVESNLGTGTTVIVRLRADMTQPATLRGKIDLNAA